MTWMLRAALLERLALAGAGGPSAVCRLGVPLADDTPGS